MASNDGVLAEEAGGDETPRSVHLRSSDADHRRTRADRCVLAH
jgi:hypothetical protein